MLPLTDHLPARRTPVINYLIIAANVAMFVWELSLGPNVQQALYEVAFVPRRFWIPGYLVPNGRDGIRPSVRSARGTRTRLRRRSHAPVIRGASASSRTSSRSWSTMR